jgi:excisionase family DNA binding protein
MLNEVILNSQDSDKELTTNQEMFTVRKTAEYLNLSKARIMQLIKSGKLTPETVETTLTGKKYLFKKEYIDKWKEKRYSDKGNREERKVIPITPEFTSYHQNKLDELQAENRTLLLELGRAQGLYQGKDDQIRQIQNILTERAESLIEKEAKIKELEAKMEDEKNTLINYENKINEEKKIKEILITEKQEIETIFQEEKKLREDTEKKLENERKEKEELMKQLILLNMPWWKKFFHTKEKLEEEIQKKLK